MRPISGFSDCAARLRMDYALAALLVASPGSGPPGSPNLSSRFSAAPLERGEQRTQLGDLLQPVPAGARQRFLRHLLVVPGHVVGDVHCACTKLEDRDDIGTQRVPDHDELAGVDSAALEDAAV